MKRNQILSALAIVLALNIFSVFDSSAKTTAKSIKAANHHIVKQLPNRRLHTTSTSVSSTASSAHINSIFPKALSPMPRLCLHCTVTVARSTSTTWALTKRPTVTALQFVIRKAQRMDVKTIAGMSVTHSRQI